MADQAETQDAPVEGQNNAPEQEQDEQRVPYERFQAANKKAKEAADRAKKLEADLADIRSQMEERETQGLPELERERKRAEQLEKRAADAEQRAQDTENRLANTQREQWITAAATGQKFSDPEDASRFVDLAEIESRDDAERAVKRVAKAKKYLLQSEDPKMPGRVLEGGRNADPQQQDGRQPARTSREADAEAIGTALNDFLASRGKASGGPLLSNGGG